MENLIVNLHNKIFGAFTLKVVCAVTNNPNAGGIKRAEKHGIEVKIIDNKEFTDREDFDKALVNTIQSFNPDITVLAGFMRILTPIFTKNIKALNIHPSILPLFKGANALSESFHSDMKIAGVTVHYVSEELDSGEIVAQACLQKIKNETFESFKQRIHALEHSIYPQAVLDSLKG